MVSVTFVNNRSNMLELVRRRHIQKRVIKYVSVQRYGSSDVTFSFYHKIDWGEPKRAPHMW